MGQYVALEEVPNIMRALGFYPTELQVQDMINEVKFSQYVDTGKTVSKSRPIHAQKNRYLLDFVFRMPSVITVDSHILHYTLYFEIHFQSTVI